MNRNFRALDAVLDQGSARAQLRSLTVEGLAEQSVLDRRIEAASDALINRQSASGFWQFELEADCTIPAEYIVMMHFLDEIDPALEAKIATYLRAQQTDDGGWPLYYAGEPDISCSVKAYFALKLAGDSPQAPHMVRAREAILERGGAARANVFTRIMLAQFGQIPWRGVPYIPVEIMLLPRWFPFHLDKVAYWARTVMIPLFILCTRQAQGKNPRNVDVRELFTTAPERERHYFQLRPGRSGLLARAFLVFDRCVRRLDPLIPKRLRAHAARRAEAWILERLNGDGGLGAIFPAMVNALEALAVLGYPSDDPRRLTAKRAVEMLLVVKGAAAYCQPCVSPTWDTALTALTMQEAGTATAAVDRALDWLKSQQLLEEPGDWQVNRPDLPGGGWPFQFENGHYPDLDDTAAIVWALQRADDPARFSDSLTRGLNWLVGMQSTNGGFAAYDIDNDAEYLNQIPFADHDALVDPPTSDVTARVVTVLGLARRPQDQQALERAIAFLRKEQAPDGSWFGRWGTNYIYGTWSVLTAFARAGIRADDEAVRRAVSWLVARQNPDGGWGESNDTYARELHATQRTASNPHQSAWALLGLLSAGEVRSVAVRRGVEYLLQTQQESGLWSDPHFTAPGFPRVFYLKYHGYCAYFPLWALAAYRNLARAESSH